MMRSQRLMMAGGISEAEFKRNIKEVIRCLQESRHILLLEPFGSNEHEMGAAAAVALTEMGVQWREQEQQISTVYEWNIHFRMSFTLNYFTSKLILYEVSFILLKMKRNYA